MNFVFIQKYPLFYPAILSSVQKSICSMWQYTFYSSNVIAYLLMCYIIMGNFKCLISERYAIFKYKSAFMYNIINTHSALGTIHKERAMIEYSTSNNVHIGTLWNEFYSCNDWNIILFNMVIMLSVFWVVTFVLKWSMFDAWYTCSCLWAISDTLRSKPWSLIHAAEIDFLQLKEAWC